MTDELIIDNREMGLLTYLQFPSKQLPVGDVWIGAQGDTIQENGVIIERKTVNDLEASILDSRYREQRSRMISYATEQKASVCYIIEGSLDRHGQVRLEKKALLKFITRLCLRYHIPVFYTSSTKDTADLILCMKEQWDEDKTTFKMPASMTYIETRGNTRQANTDDPTVFAVSVLTCCRGISKAAATSILKVFGSLPGVFRATKEQLGAVLIGAKKLGPMKANRLFTLLSTQTLQFHSQSQPEDHRPMFEDDT
jgi:ERCC4-type nuclease